MDLRQLKYFTALIEARSFTAAAELLHVAQPAVSTQIHKLEEELGAKLVRRHSRGIEPTEAGRRLLVHAGRILGEVEAARQDLREFGRVPTGNIRLGMPRSVGDMLALDILEHCRRELPKVKISIVEWLSEGLNELIAGERIDFALLHNPHDIKSVSYSPLLRLNLSLIVPVGIEVGTNPDGSVDLAEVAKLPLILPSMPHGLRTTLETAAAEAGLSINAAYEIDSVALIKDMVEARFACTILSYSMVHRMVAEKKVVDYRIVNPPLTRILYLARSHKRAPSRAQVAVQNLVTRLLQEFIACNAAHGVADMLGQEPPPTQPVPQDRRRSRADAAPA